MKARNSGVADEPVLTSVSPVFPASRGARGFAGHMDHSATFARHFARLVSLLMHETGNVDEQKVSLRALVTVSKSERVILVADDWQLTVNGDVVPGALTGVQDVTSQMTAHSIRSIEVEIGS